MANVSDANGLVCISDCSVQDGKRVLQILNKYQSTFYYNTCYEYIDSNDNEVHASFYANGRWCFENNLEMIGYNLKDCMTEDENNYIKSIDFRLTYDYTDCERGYDYYVKGIVELVHEKGTAIEKMIITNESFEDLKYSLWRTTSILNMSIDESLDYVDYVDYDSILDDWDYIKDKTKAFLQQSINDYAENLKYTKEAAVKYLCSESWMFADLYDLCQKD